MERFWPEYLQAKYLELKHLLPYWPEFIPAKPAILFGYLARYCYFCSYILDWIYSGQDCHNFLTHNCKLSQSEWKGLGFFQAEYLKSKHLLPFWPEFIQAKPAICLDF
jgi:hypothetical protein